MSHPLTAVDNAWLRMERPDNLMMITGVLTFDAPLDMERLKALLTHRVGWFSRFRQRVEDGRWLDVPGFDVADHIEHEMLPQPADRATLRRRISELVSTPLDFSRPLWRMHVLENPNDGRTLVLARLHHCLGDGFALMYVTLGLTDESADTPIERDDYEAPRSPEGGWLKRFGELSRMARAVAQQVRGTRPMQVAKVGAALGGDLWRLATLSSQPKTRLRGPLGPQKAAAWSAPVPLAEIKATGKRLGGTVNDVLMTAVAGALRSYLVEHGESGFDMRTVVPVNLRTLEEMKQLGNRFGLVFLELPLDVPDPRERFRITKARMDALKRSPEAVVLWHMMQLTGGGPLWFENLVIRILGAKSTAVITNVPGPREPRYMAGEQIQTIMFWVPQTGRVGLGVSVISYNGEVRLGLSVDANLIPDPETVLDAFPRELARLAEA